MPNRYEKSLKTGRVEWDNCSATPAPISVEDT